LNYPNTEIVGIVRTQPDGSRRSRLHPASRPAHHALAKRLAPLHYVHFLDYAAGRIFLRKVGGGYIFVHRLLLEYFASLEPEEESS